MKLQKIISIFLIFIFLPISSVFAETVTASSSNEIITALQNAIKKYDDMIKTLQDENAKLLKLLEDAKKGAAPVTANIESTAPVVNKTPIKASEVDKYNIIIEKINSLQNLIISDNNLAGGSTIWLFEFIEPSSFFISIDDNNNPAWITAFKKKILYSYDKDYNFNITWIFDLDYNTEYYITKYWKNPFAKAIRIKVKNPYYKGKLLEDTVWSPVSTNTSTNSTKTTTSIATPVTSAPVTSNSNVTIDQIKKAYANNKILDALKLSNEYILKDPNNIDILKIRYRSYSMLWKHSEALAEIQKIESILTTDKMEKIVVCDAKTLSKILKNAELNKKYTDLCASKK